MAEELRNRSGECAITSGAGRGARVSNLERSWLVPPGRRTGGLGFNRGRSRLDRTGAKYVPGPQDTACLLAHAASSLCGCVRCGVETGGWAAYDERSDRNRIFQFRKNISVSVPHPE